MGEGGIVLFFPPLLPTDGETKVGSTNNKKLRCSDCRERKTREGGDWVVFVTKLFQGFRHLINGLVFVFLSHAKTAYFFLRF